MTSNYLNEPLITDLTRLTKLKSDELQGLELLEYLNSQTYQFRHLLSLIMSIFNIHDNWMGFFREKV